MLSFRSRKLQKLVYLFFNVELNYDFLRKLNWHSDLINKLNLILELIAFETHNIFFAKVLKEKSVTLTFNVNALFIYLIY